MPKFELQPNEQLIEKGNASLMKTKINLLIGKLYVTDQRFVFLPSGSTGMAALGALGGILSELIMGNKIRKQAIDVPIDQVAGYKQGKHGMNKKILDIELPEGEKRFILNAKFEKWDTALKTAGARPEQATDTQAA